MPLPFQCTCCDIGVHSNCVERKLKSAVDLMYINSEMTGEVKGILRKVLNVWFPKHQTYLTLSVL